MTEIYNSDVIKNIITTDDIPCFNSTTPINFSYSSRSIVYNDKIHLFQENYHYSFDGTTWTQEEDLPVSMSNSVTPAEFVIYDNKIHILYVDNSKYHYSWDGTTWTQEENIPYSCSGGSPVVYDNKIHLLGGYSSNGILHYSFDGTTWTQEENIPYKFYQGVAVTYNNKIHILGGNSSYRYSHYSWDGTTWTQEENCPTDLINCQYVGTIIYNNKFYILYNHYCYSWNDSNGWKIEPYIEFSNNRNVVLYNNKIYIFNSNNYYTLLIEKENKLDWVRYKWEYSTFYSGDAVVYNDKIHILGGNSTTNRHCSFNGNIWTQEENLPYGFVSGSAVVYNNKIHLLGGNNYGKYHYSWDGTTWTKDVDIPFNFYSGGGSAVVYDNKIHIFGGGTYHYSFNGTTWTQEENIPYDYTSGSVVVYDNKIHLLGSFSSTGVLHYSFDGTTWTQEENCPYAYNSGYAVVYDNKIHLLGGRDIYKKYHYSFNGISWTKEEDLLSDFWLGNAVVYNNKMYLLGGNGSSNQYWVYDFILPNILKQYYFSKGKTIVYKNKIYIIGGNPNYSINNKRSYTYFIYDGTSFIQKFDLPYNFNSGAAVVYNDKIHILGGINIDNIINYTKHYSFDGTTWTQEEDLPYNFVSGSAVVYDNKIHLIYNNNSKHYSWDGTTWKNEGLLPYNINYGSVVVYDNKIHILGGNSVGYNSKYHYSWGGNGWSGWTKEKDIPYDFYNGSAVVYDNKIHIFGSSSPNEPYKKSHYSWNGTVWSDEKKLSYNFNYGDGVVYDNKIYLFGGEESYTKKTIISFFDYTGINEINYGKNTLLSLKNDDLLLSTDVVKNIITHNKEGIPINGSRPPYYKNNSSKYIYVCQPMTNFNTYDTKVFYMRDNRQVNIHTASKAVYMTSTMLNGNTSSITIAAPSTDGDEKTFVLEKVIYLNSNQVMICYYWNAISASTSLKVAANLRVISMKNDGSLLMGTNIGISAAETTALMSEYTISKGLQETYMITWMNTTYATGTIALYSRRALINLTTGAFTQDTSAYVTSGSGVNMLPIIDTNLVPLKNAGYFFRNNSNVDNVIIFASYNTGNVRTATLANADTSGDLASLGIYEHYFLGYLKNGLLASIKEHDGIYLWYMDWTTATNFLSKRSYIPFDKVGKAWHTKWNIPYSFYQGSAVVWGDKINLLGTGANSNYYKYHYWTDQNSAWASKSTLPYNFYQGCAVIYNDEIHILGSLDSSNYTKHYCYNGSSWVSKSTLPYDFYLGAAVVYNNKIHILGGGSGTKNHYSWNGTSWTKEMDLPGYATKCCAVVCYDKIHLFGLNNDLTAHYSWDGTSWTKESTLPYAFKDDAGTGKGCVVVYNNKIHILGGANLTGHYSWDGADWTEESTLPYEFINGAALVYDNKIWMFGSQKFIYKGNTSVYNSVYKCCYWDGRDNKCSILSFENDVLTLNDGSRYQIVTDSIKELSPVEVVNGGFFNITYDMIGPESSTFDCTYIYGE